MMREVGSLVGERFKRLLLVGCLSIVIGIPITACFLGFLFVILLPWIESVSVEQGQTAGTVLIVGLGVGLIFLMMVVPFGFYLVMTRRRAAALDKLFSPLGLTGSMYMLHGRHYQGQYHGREIDIFIYRGPTMEFRLQTRTAGRLAVTPDGSLPASLAGLFGSSPVITNDPLLDRLTVFAKDKAWAANLLAIHPAAQALQVLMTFGAAWAIIRRVEIQPGVVLLYLYRSRNLVGQPLTPDEIQAWLDALEALAHIGESVPPPAVVEPESVAGSRQSRQNLNRNLGFVMFGLVIGLPVCLLLVGLIAFLIVS